MAQYIVDNGDGTYGVKSCKGFIPSGMVMMVPGGTPPEDIPFMTVEIQVIDGATMQVAVIDQDKKAAYESEVSLEETKKNLRDQYLYDIDQQMLVIFGTTNRDKSSSLYLTWQLMAQSPMGFADKGLVDDVGAPLDSHSKVSSYVSTKLTLVKDYSVFLLTRERTYKDAVANL